jgi:6-phosphogluconate dehydrogenase
VEKALGVIGLGTMGAALARNAARNGVFTIVYNRTAKKTDEFIAEYGEEGNITGKKTYEDFIAALPTPRAILIMVKAGDAVDKVIEDIAPLLEKDDIIIDGGNSHYKDTARRADALQATSYKLQAHPIRYLGMGISGGEEGALNGPSLMPGGNESAYEDLTPLLEDIAASDGARGRCVTYLGEGGAGHFVKMVHNGIEYGMMQIIAECYDYLKTLGEFSNEQLAETFEAWGKSDELGGFLMEITGEIFKKGDGESNTPSPVSSPLGRGRSGKHLIDLIADRAGRKGTGRWTIEAALEYGVPVPTISAALFARIVSGDSDLRDRAGKAGLPESLDTSEPLFPPLKMSSAVRSACELSIFLSYMQGFELLKKASEDEEWNLNLSEVARIWRGGCIIRSTMLPLFQRAYGSDTKEAKAAKEAILERFDGNRQYEWRHTVDLGTSRGIPLPALCASLAYYDSIRRDWLPQNLTQAQRDYFGAHGFERIDKKGSFHTDWQE